MAKLHKVDGEEQGRKALLLRSHGGLRQGIGQIAVEVETDLSSWKAVAASVPHFEGLSSPEPLHRLPAWKGGRRCRRPGPA